MPNLVGYGPRTIRQASPTTRRWGWTRGDARPGCGHLHHHAPVSRRADDREPLRAEQDAPTGALLPGPGETAPAPTRPVARYLPSRRYASWPRIWVLILEAWSAAARVA